MIVAIMAPVTKLKEQTAEDIAELEAEGDRIVSFNLEVNILQEIEVEANEGNHHEHTRLKTAEEDGQH